MNEESEDTLSVPQSLEEIKKCILSAKLSAIEDAKQCSMSLDDYDDRSLIIDSVNELLDEDDDDDEDDDSNGNDAVNTSENITNISDEVALLIQEDSTQIRLSKNLQNGMPTYTTTTDKGTQKNKTYQHSQFIEYQGAYIRKSTALYLLQENPVLSSDRLIRVRANNEKSSSEPARNETTVTSGDLCVFKQINTQNKILFGRMIQFSYLAGTKRQQEYSGMYVDLREPSYNTIGAFANWYARDDESDNSDFIELTPIKHSFQIGYVSMENYVCMIPNANFVTTESGSFAVTRGMEIENLDDWQNMLSKRSEFDEEPL